MLPTLLKVLCFSEWLGLFMLDVIGCTKNILFCPLCQLNFSTKVKEIMYLLFLLLCRVLCFETPQRVAFLLGPFQELYFLIGPHIEFHFCAIVATFVAFKMLHWNSKALEMNL